MTESGPSQSRLEALTALRAFSALWVVLFHVHCAELFGRDTLDWLPLVDYGYLGVDLFFVLSGFILMHQYEAKLSEFNVSAYAKFLGKRLARIYPLHIVTMVLSWVLFQFNDAPTVVNGHDIFSAKAAFLNLTLMHAWGFSDGLSFNAPSWSLSCEWLAYLCFPLALRVIARVQSARAAVASALVSIALVFVALRLSGRRSIDVTYDLGVLRIAGEFIAGLAAYRAFKAWPVRFPSGPLLVGLSVVYVFACLAVRRAEYSVLSFPWLIVGLGQVSFQVRGRLSALVLLLGEASFAMYMLHHMLILRLREVYVESAATAWPLALRASALVLSLVALSLLSIAAFRYVEDPCRRWGRRAASWLLERRLPSARPEPSVD